ncbi:MAG TPA: hypothetical protein VMI06_19225 [Terriglobia bacterium]|nr:hypothetical protein [Terriglobia bacterium]
MGQIMDRSTRFLTGPPRGFEEVFPSLQDVLIESRETGKGTCDPWTRAYSEERFSAPQSLIRAGGLIRCSNGACNRGGYEIEFDIYRMLRDGLVTKEFEKMCPGDEGSPKGRRPGRKCFNRLRYRLTLVYKPEHTPAPNASA